MSLKISNRNIKYVVLLIIPFLILFAIEGTFSVQSIIPAIIILTLNDIISYAKIREHNKTRKRVVLICGLFLISSLASLSLNTFFYPTLINNLSYIRIVYFFVILYFYFALCDLKLSKKQLSNVLIANIIAGVCISLSLIFINHIWVVNIFNVMLDKNFVGAFLAVQAEFALMKFLDDLCKKIIWIVFYFIIIVGIFFSASRASILVVILGSFVTIFFHLKKYSKTKKGAIMLFIGMIVLPLTATVFFFYLSAKMKNTNSVLQWYWNRYFVNGFRDDSVVGRIIWWKEAIFLWLRRPVFGYGIGNVNVSGNSSAVAHNTYLDFLLDQGLCGFLGFLLILFDMLKRTFKIINKDIYGVVISVLLNALILSATKSTYLWYTLIIICVFANAQLGQN